ncbi:MAG: transposase, partial [Psychromonas sp.]|nr:transposase [Psychromonas sp.]
MKKANKQLLTDIQTLQDSLLEARSLLERKANIILEKNEIILEKDKIILQTEGQVQDLLAQLRLSRAQRFAPSSEKQNPQQLELFDEAEHIIATESADDVDPADEVESEAQENTSPKARKPRGRRELPAHLPRIDVFLELSKDELLCPHDGHALHKIGEDISEKIEIIPARIQVIRYHRFKYGCRFCEDGIHYANVPKQAFPKSNATEATLAFIAVSKYQDALPLHRLEQMFKRDKILIPRHTMAGWMIKLGNEILSPLLTLMRQHLLAQPLIHYDETTCQVLVEEGKTP